MFGELGSDGHLAGPANARGQCIRISEAFGRMLARRGIPAETVDGFRLTWFPPFKQEAVVPATLRFRLLPRAPNGTSAARSSSAGRPASSIQTHPCPLSSRWRTGGEADPAACRRTR